MTKFFIPSQIKLIIFDLGNVMIPINMAATASAFAQLGVPNIQKYVNQSHSMGGFFTDFEQGLISPTVFCDKLREMTNLPLTNEQITQAWNAMIGSFPEENVRLVEQLKQTHTVVLLSNTNKLHFDAFDHLAPGYPSLSALFHKTYYSHELHLSKPNPEIFQFVLRDNNVDAPNAAFYDDSPANIAAATALGIQSFLIQ